MRFEVTGLLFDLDGTLVSSLAAVDRAWTWYSQRHGLEASDVLKQIHGRRSEDSIRLLTPHVDVEAENMLMRQRETEDTGGVVAIEGAKLLLAHLPPHCWGIVTSCTEDVARARVAAAGLPMPDVFVTAEAVRHGKPAPDCFLEGAKRLKMDPKQCLAFEDTRAGILASKAAGMKCVGVAAISGRSELEDANVVVNDFRSIAVSQKPNGLFVIAWP